MTSKIEILSISDAWPSRKESFLKKASVVVAAFYSRNSDVRISHNPPNSDVRILACSMRVRGGDDDHNGSAHYHYGVTPCAWWCGSDTVATQKRGRSRRVRAGGGDNSEYSE